MRALCLACGQEFENLTVCPKDGFTLTQIGVQHLVGQLLDQRYKIVEVLGVGRTGLVCKALQLSTNRYVAVKVMHRHLMTSQESVARYQREAQATSRLKHPNILVVIDFGFSSPGQPYMVTEYINGVTLGSVVDLGGPLPVERALPIFMQLCDAMTMAHSEQVLHRDLRPSNVMIALDPNRGELAKVIDFGFVKFLDGVDQQKLTQSSQMFGSPVYMCPEQVKGEILDIRSDVYSLGGIMYFTLTGRPPYEGNNMSDCMAKLLEEDPLPFASVLADLRIPASLEQVVLKAMAKDRTQRHANTQALKADLEKISRELFPVTATTAQPPGKPQASPAAETVDPSQPLDEEGWKPLELPKHLASTFRPSGPAEPEEPRATRSTEEVSNKTQSHELSQQFRRSAETRAFVGEQTGSWLMNVDEELHPKVTPEEQQCQMPTLELMNRLFDDFKRYAYHFNLTEENRQLMVTCTLPRKGFDLSVRGQIENSLWVISAVGHSDVLSFYFSPSEKVKPKTGSKSEEKVLFVELKSQAMMFGRKFWFIDNHPLFVGHLPSLSKKIFARLRRVSVNEVDLNEAFDFNVSQPELEEETSEVEPQLTQSPMEIITYSLIAALDALNEELMFLRHCNAKGVESEHIAKQVVEKTKQLENLQKQLTTVAEEWVKILET